MKRIERDERRARLVRRQFLDRTAPSIEEVAGDLAGIHSSDPATVYLACWARVPGITSQDIADALYEGRSVLRLLGMRRTMFVVPRSFGAVMDAATTRGYAPAQRRRLASWIEDSGVADDGDEWIDDVGRRTRDALAAGGPATARELTRSVPELATKIGVPGGSIGASTRILFLLAIEGDIVRGRPRGTWVSTQYEWATMEDWIGGRLEPIDPASARASLLRRWLAAFGPVTEKDCAWWTGWTLRDTRTALADIEAETVGLDEGTGYVLPDSLADAAPVDETDVALLPALDPTSMGWKERAWFLGPHAPQLFDRNGNIGPTVWAAGRIVGGWGHAPDGTIAVQLLEPIDSRAEDAIAEHADALSTWIGDVRIKARFPTPIEKEIRG